MKIANCQLQLANLPSVSLNQHVRDVVRLGVAAREVLNRLDNPFLESWRPCGAIVFDQVDEALFSEHVARGIFGFRQSV